MPSPATGLRLIHPTGVLLAGVMAMIAVSVRESLVQATEMLACANEDTRPVILMWIDRLLDISSEELRRGKSWNQAMRQEMLLD